MKQGRGIAFWAAACALISIMPAYAEELQITSIFIKDKIDVDTDSPVWGKIKPLNIPLSSQIFEDPKASTLPKKRSSVRSLSVKSINNGQIIAFFLEWEDAAKNSRQQGVDTFRDAAALQFPVNEIIGDEGVPSFTMGNTGNPVNIWYWKAEENSAVEALMAEGFGTLTQQIHSDVKGKGIWRNGKWSLVFSKSMDVKDGVIFARGKSLFIAFAIWDGSNMERDGQKSITTWYRLKME